MGRAAVSQGESHGAQRSRTFQFRTSWWAPEIEAPESLERDDETCPLTSLNGGVELPEAISRKKLFAWTASVPMLISGSARDFGRSKAAGRKRLEGVDRRWLRCSATHSMLLPLDRPRTAQDRPCRELIWSRESRRSRAENFRFDARLIQRPDGPRRPGLIGRTRETA
jgi:hypothetical protein